MARNVVVIVSGNGLLFEAAGIVDIFARANRALPPDSRLERYACVTATSGSAKVVTGSSGVRLLADANLAELEAEMDRDTVLVAGGGSAANPEAMAEVAAWVRRAAPRARRVVSVCAGAFVLAEAGLLSGKRATTHWLRAADLERRYPDVTVEADSIYVRDGKIATSAGATAGFDLALALVEEDLGSEIAREVARDLVIYLRRPGGQSQFSAPLRRQAKNDRRIRDLQLWALEHLAEDLRVERLAERTAMSPRNFARVFREEVGVPPARFVEELRLEAARRSLEETEETVEGIAASCGLGSATSLRRAFSRELGVSPQDYRARFGRNGRFPAGIGRN
jgi:transcriptional regulator GlxA family with amidase domain